MKETVFTLWDDPDSTKIRFFPAAQKRGDGTVVIFAGGGYYVRAPYEEIDYALRLNEYGLNVFTVDYRVAPDRFPLPLLGTGKIDICQMLFQLPNLFVGDLPRTDRG